MLLIDRQIAALVSDLDMISPYVGEKVSRFPASDTKLMSFGQTSISYDSRLDKVFFFYPRPGYQPGDSIPDQAVDPAALTEACDLKPAPVYYDNGRAFAVLESGTFALVTTVESWRLPPYIAVLTQGKSSYTRMGLIYQVTAYDPGWAGVPTFSIHNPTPFHVKLFIGEGICQSLIFHTDQTPESLYTGKYQGSRGLTPAL